VNNLTDLIFIIYCIQFKPSRDSFAPFRARLNISVNGAKTMKKSRFDSISNSSFTLLFSPQITCSGLFELRLKSFRNDDGVNSLGRCCSEKLMANGTCQGGCKTRFRVCLKQYQAEIDTVTPCTFGAAATQILGDNTFNLTQFATATSSQPQKGASINPIRFPFNFTWPVSTFCLLLHSYIVHSRAMPLNLCGGAAARRHNNAHKCPANEKVS
jgi:N terminus of Notch ligand